MAGGNVGTQREVADAKRQNQKLIEENHMLSLKVDILLDLVFLFLKLLRPPILCSDLILISRLEQLHTSFVQLAQTTAEHNALQDELDAARTGRTSGTFARSQSARK